MSMASMARDSATGTRPTVSAVASAIQSITAAYDTANLRHALASYPTRIKAQRDLAQRARREHQNAEQSRAELEAELLLAVSVETDDKGKARFTNAEARAAELLRRKAAHPAYAATAAAVTRAEAALVEAQDTLSLRLDEYQSARIVARLIAAEMSALSEIIDLEDRVEVELAGVMATEFPRARAGRGK